MDHFVALDNSYASGVLPEVHANPDRGQELPYVLLESCWKWPIHDFLIEAESRSSLGNCATNPCPSVYPSSGGRGRLCLDPLLGYRGENGGAWASFTLGAGMLHRAGAGSQAELSGSKKQGGTCDGERNRRYSKESSRRLAKVRDE